MAKSKEKDPGFEESLASLERIVSQLESGELPLERALELFEEGVGLARRCQTQLEQAERKVELLLRDREELKTAPFGGAAASEAAPAPTRANLADAAEADSDAEAISDDAIPF